MSSFRAIILAVVILALPGFAAATTPFLVYFDSGSAELTKRGERNLEIVVQILLVTCPRSRVAVIGHDDLVLSETQSLVLSKDRARNVAARLRDLKVDADRIGLAARGQRSLARVTSLGVAEPLNRRVEITIGDCE